MRRAFPLALLLFVGCTDLPSSPRISAPADPARMYRTTVIGGRQYLLFRTADEARSQLSYAEIWGIRPSVRWSGNTAIGKSEMDYFGTDGEQKLSIAAANPSSSIKVEGTTTDSHMIPYRYIFSTPELHAPLLGTVACGGVASLTANYLAKVVIAIEIPYITPNGISYDTDFGSLVARQSACQNNPCPSGTVQSTTDPNKCYANRDEPSDGGGGDTDCPDCVTDPVVTYCRVRYWYWKDTGEVFSSTVLFCA